MTHRLTPLLVVRDAPRAIHFYVQAFGATVIARYLNNELGTISHCDLDIAGARFSLTEELPAVGARALPATLQLSVDDAGAAFGQACAAGAEVVFPLQEFCGERMARLRDPFGHEWIVHQRLEELSPEENQRQRDVLFASLARAQRAHRESSIEGPLSTMSAKALAEHVRARKIGAVELTRHFIDRIERLDPKINAVVVRDFERALEAAKKVDAERGDGALLGVPITVKEAFGVAGLPSSWGVPAFAKNVVHEDAAVVARLRKAGAIVLGKTNVPPMLGDFQTTNEIYGTTNNPWDDARGPGGSSGGSAAAIAAGLSALECGSDIGGSVRGPAHACGVYAHKPTFGTVSMKGHELPGVPLAPDMAVAGPIARSAEDLALALDVLAGHDEEAFSLALPAPRATALSDLRIAVWSNAEIAAVDDEIVKAAERIAEVARRRGAKVSEVARPEFDVTSYRATYVALVSSVMGAAAPDDLYRKYEAAARALDPNDTSKIAMSTRGLVLGHRAWLRHDAERRRLRALWTKFFQAWDVLVCPIMATPAMLHDARPPLERTVLVNGRAQPYFDQVFWASLATLAYLPATVFPAGRSKAGLPLGLQAIGAPFADRTTIEFARLVAEEIGGFTPPPGLD